MIVTASVHCVTHSLFADPLLLKLLGLSGRVSDSSMPIKPFAS